MKKLISLLMILAFCATLLVSCGGPSKELTAAKDILYAMYKDSAEVTASDYEVVSLVSRNGVSYPITWTAEVKSGSADGVKIVAGDKITTVDVDEKTTEEITYVLTATISDPEGKTISVSFNHKVPQFKELTWDEFVAAEDDTTVVVKGVVTAIMSKTNGNSYNCLYLQDADGGYYAYGMASDPVTDGIEVGMTVRVTGTRDTYSGTYEIAQGTGVAEIIDTNKTTVTPVDYTEKFAKAASLKDADLIAKQSMLVTIKGVEVVAESDSDISSGYYRFKLGSLNSYVRISSSVCPISKDDQTAFKAAHASHTGWTANVTGVICVYDGAFYLTPVSVDGFEYVSLPAKSDAEMVAFEKENLAVATAITADGEIELPTTGKGYTQVSVSWTSDNECAVVTGGKLVITLPETATVIKLTATITAGSSTDTKEFEVAVDAASSDAYIAKKVESPVAGTAYKLTYYQAILGKQLYFTGAMDGKYLAMSDKAEKAVDVTLEEVEGGYTLSFMSEETKQYLEIFADESNKVNAHITTTPVNTFKYDETLGTLIATISGTDYYIGTYKTYTTGSVSKTSYISGDNVSLIGVSQFPIGFATLAPATYDGVVATEATAEKSFKLGFYQAVVGAQYYFTGAMDGKYLATSDKLEKAVDVTLEAVDGGYVISFVSGDTKQYIDVYLNESGKTAIQLTETKPAGVFTFNTEANTLVITLGGTDYYLGTYNALTTVSASKTSYILGDNLSKVGVTQFPFHLTTPVLRELEITDVDVPEADGTYVVSFNQAILGARYYLDGKMDGKYLGTTDKVSKAVRVTLEKAENGYYLVFLQDGVKMYFDVYADANGKVNVQITETPSGALTYDETLKTLVASIAGTNYYMGTYKTYTTVSASKTQYIEGDNVSLIGVSQFPIRLTSVK